MMFCSARVLAMWSALHAIRKSTCDGGLLRCVPRAHADACIHCFIYLLRCGWCWAWWRPHTWTRRRIHPSTELQRTLLHNQLEHMRQGSSLSSASSSTRGMDKVEPKQQICFDFTKGACSRGDTCKYSHDIALIVSINSQERGICFDHLKGQCNRGLLCRFSHDLSFIAMQHKQVWVCITWYMIHQQ